MQLLPQIARICYCRGLWAVTHRVTEVFASEITVPEVKSACKGEYIVDLVSYFQGKEIYFFFFNEMIILHPSKGRGRIQKHLWWANATEEKV